MSLTKITVLFALLITALLTTGCFQEKDMPQEGDIVTWKQNDELVIKAKLGQRREHVRKSPFFYPELEHFVGQFPIEYKPEQFPVITKEEVEQLPYPYIGHELMFSLMLNGSESIVTNETWVFADHGFSHHDQVQVMLVNRNGLLHNTQQEFELRLKKKLAPSTKTIMHGMDCYRSVFALEHKLDSWSCFGESTHALVSGFRFVVSEEGNIIIVSSVEQIYGGVELVWSTDKKHIHRVKEIDAAIWRLLDSWNIAPTQ